MKSDVVFPLLLTIGVVCACGPATNLKQKYTTTITGFQLPTEYVYFQRYTLGSDTKIKNTAGSIDVAKRNFRDMADRVLREALKDGTGYDFNKDDNKFTINQDVLTCEGIAAEVADKMTNSVDLTNPIGCGVENGLVVGTCTVLADCKDKTKWKPVDSKYTNIVIEMTPTGNGAPEKWTKLAESIEAVKKSIISKLQQKLKGAQVSIN